MKEQDKTSKETINKKKANNKNCYAFCPKCGSDIYYYDHQCICKNKDCNWLCDKCKED